MGHPSRADSTKIHLNESLFFKKREVNRNKTVMTTVNNPRYVSERIAQRVETSTPWNDTSAEKRCVIGH